MLNKSYHELNRVLLLRDEQYYYWLPGGAVPEQPEHEKRGIRRIDLFVRYLATEATYQPLVDAINKVEVLLLNPLGDGSITVATALLVYLNPRHDLQSPVPKHATILDLRLRYINTLALPLLPDVLDELVLHELQYQRDNAHGIIYADWLMEHELWPERVIHLQQQQDLWELANVLKGLEDADKEILFCREPGPSTTPGTVISMSCGNCVGCKRRVEIGRLKERLVYLSGRLPTALKSALHRSCLKMDSAKDSGEKCIGGIVVGGA